MQINSPVEYRAALRHILEYAEQIEAGGERAISSAPTPQAKMRARRSLAALRETISEIRKELAHA